MISNVGNLDNKRCSTRQWHLSAEHYPIPYHLQSQRLSEAVWRNMAQSIMIKVD